MLLASRPSKLLPASAVGEKQQSICALLLHPSLHWEATQGDMEPQHAVAFLDLRHHWCIPEGLLHLGCSCSSSGSESNEAVPACHAHPTHSSLLHGETS